ncbi:GNAT family N-acetyltransferase [Paenibacillus woosongensis]|uniref:GNAT family N-acetyltransferase n=1 Tax=Paenibacillus woosongensis TaxID=307580 RepID=A0AA95I739_9BACL|nr:GNAT family N-acetyltransferase [Paenibacillus woosongensis]WHX50970.1 GNAT family N-acetyltransferase [Paenibacillus woosongensis]
MKQNKYVRLAVVDDAQALAQLNREFNGVEASHSDIKQCLVDSGEVVVIAILNDEPVGFACGQSYQSFCYCELAGEITELYVREGARRQGLAAELIHEIEAELKRRGVRTIKVHTGLRNEAAMQTYTNSHYIKKDEVVFQKNI